MSHTTPLFAWRDRDTAARCMIDLAHLAPPTIRLRALQLISAFKSAAVSDALIEIVMDDSRKIWERRYALYGLSADPTGDLYLPQLAPLISDAWDGLDADYFFGFIAKHPKNQAWFFETIMQFPPEVYGKWLASGQILWVDETVDMAELIYPHLLAFSEQYPDLMTELELSIEFDPNQPQDLTERWQPPTSYPLHSCWDWLVRLRDAILEGDKDARIVLTLEVYPFVGVPQSCAAAIHLLGTLEDEALDYAIGHIRAAFEYNLGLSEHKSGRCAFNYVRFEAGEILKNITTPETWELMVDVFLSDPGDNDIAGFTEEWIEHLTDCLSTGNKPYTGSEWALPRYWLEESPENS